MKFKTTVFSLALISFAGAAQATDFTGSLYLPNAGQVLSNTSIEFSREKFKSPVNGASNALYANQEFTYGVTNEFSIVGAVGNHFNYQNKSDPLRYSAEHNRDLNPDYLIGGKYNLEHGRIVGQVGLAYYTFNPKDFWGRSTPAKWYKEVQVNAQVGYKLTDDLTPYTSLTAYNRDAFSSHRPIDYVWFVGAHKTCGRFAFDGGIRYEFTTYGPNTNETFLQAEANYFVTDNVAVGVFGDYLLGGSNFKKDRVKYDYTAGLNLKVLF
jgi:hypothetical protein